MSHDADLGAQPSDDRVEPLLADMNTTPPPNVMVPTDSASSDSGSPSAVAQRRMIGLSTAKIQKAHAAQVTETSLRKPRHCKKCGAGPEIMCGGRRGVSFCTRACQDCKKMECLGRDPKLDKPCWDVKERREKSLGKAKKRKRVA
ncbi:hypothetical protein BKA70DRAFT_1401096 [Coprinopsis sp. MPI-PUGE-AT-0042]|nr:hypothetical protein BKA70DRAFT_1401096 [Coprinopsis sp. MPI-PUGE-AT-0042]